MYKDKGANHFQDFEHFVDLRYISGGSEQQFAVVCTCFLTNDLGDICGLKTANKTAIGIQSYRNNSNPLIRAYEVYQGNAYKGDDLTMPYDTWRYFRFRKYGTTLTLKMYGSASDRDNDENVLATSQLTLHANHEFRYIMAVVSWNSNTPVRHQVIDLENLDLNEGVYCISGYTRDANGNPLPNCTLYLFRSSDKAFLQETASSETGYYSFEVGDSTTRHFICAHKDGTPNVFGATDDDLVGS